MEKSWNFASPKKWEPCLSITTYHLFFRPSRDYAKCNTCESEKQKKIIQDS